MSTSPSDPLRRVVVVAERRLVGQAISAALGRDHFLALLLPWPRRGALRDLRRAVARSRAPVGIILCNLETPDRLRDVELVLERVPLPWLVLTDNPPGPRWGTVLEGGAFGVLPTTTSTDGLAAALRESMAGRSPTPDAVRVRAVSEWQEIAESQRQLVRRMEQLTHREFEVLGCLYDGMSVQRIAASAGVAEATVRSQVKSLRRKLEVDSQLAAVALYRKALEVFPRTPV